MFLLDVEGIPRIPSSVIGSSPLATDGVIGPSPTVSMGPSQGSGPSRGFFGDTGVSSLTLSSLFVSMDAEGKFDIWKCIYKFLLAARIAILAGGGATDPLQIPSTL